MRIDVSQFMRDQEATGKRSTDESIHTRPEYRESGHSSVNMGATTFGKPKPSARDIAENADQQVPGGLEFATAADGSGDKTQTDQSVQTIESNGSVGPFTDGQWNQYKTRLGQRESGNDYSKVNTIGFSGRWQFGGPSLQDLGYVKPGTSTRSLKRDSAWTGKDGINSHQAFLQNREVQDKCILTYTRINYKALLRMKVVDKTTDPATVGGFLAAAHLKGAGGARDLKNGRNGRDAYGTDAGSYYTMMSSELGGTNSDPTTAAFASPISAEQKQEYEQRVNQNVVSDAATFSFPSSQAAPQYPYNTITEYESGHFKEYDSTPGNERIQERHKSGTGYEVMADGTKRNIVVGNNYTAILGNDYILVNGSVQIIVNGDCGLKVNGNCNQSVANDYNLSVGGDFNLTVGGNRREGISGSNNTVVAGDNATQIGGFNNVSVDGDFQQEAASVNLSAKDGQINMGASKDISLVTASNINTNATGNITNAAKGNIVTAADGKASVLAKGNAVVASTGGKATVTGSSGTTIHSGGSVKLDGSAINAKPYVDRAEWANRGGQVRFASALGGSPGSAPPAQGSDGAGDAGSDQSNTVKNSDKSKVDKALRDFNAIDGTKTQSYGGGQGELNGYNGGFTYS